MVSKSMWHSQILGGPIKCLGQPIHNFLGWASPIRHHRRLWSVLYGFCHLWDSSWLFAHARCVTTKVSCTSEHELIFSRWLMLTKSTRFWTTVLTKVQIGQTWTITYTQTKSYKTKIGFSNRLHHLSSSQWVYSTAARRQMGRYEVTDNVIILYWVKYRQWNTCHYVNSSVVMLCACCRHGSTLGQRGNCPPPPPRPRHCPQCDIELQTQSISI